jgi:ribose transport system permease protein
MTPTRAEVSREVESVERPSASVPVGQRVKSVLGLHRISAAYLLLVIIITFGIWIPELFLTQATLHSIASSQAITALLALGALAPLSTGSIDISIGANANIAAVAVTLLQTDHQWPMWGAIAFTLLMSCGIGAVNGTLVVKFGLNPIIATLAMLSVITATQTIIVGAVQPFPVQNLAFPQLAQRTIFGFQSVVIYLVVLAFVMWWLLEYTPVGRYLRAVGGNAEASRLSGVKVGGWTFISFCIAGTFAGIAGIMFASQIGPSLTFGFPLLLPALTACYLGYTQILPGRFNVWGTVLAVYVLATGVKGFQLVTGAVWIPDMFNGIALIIAVGFGVRQQKRTLEARRKRAAGQRPAGTDPDLDEPPITEPKQPITDPSSP